MATVTLENIRKRFGDVKALDGLSLRLPNGRTTVVLGPSGCGKSTLLQVVAGLERPDEGKVYFDGKDMTGVPPKERQLGVVFQDSALYPGMTSRRNVLSWFVFRNRDLETDPEARARMARTAELMGVELERLLERRPRGLSPGEQQRVALARCITREPSLFLLDEPLAHLDARERQRIRVELKRLLQEFRVTTLYITHDQSEVPLLAEHLVVMDAGRVAQAGTPSELYRMPVSRFVAEFVNPDPLVPALDTLPGWRLAQRFGGRTAGARSEDVTLIFAGDPAFGEGLGVAGTVADVTPLPSRRAWLVAVDSDADGAAPVRLHALHALEAGDPRVGSRVWLRYEHFHLFDDDTGRRVGTYP